MTTLLRAFGTNEYYFIGTGYKEKKKTLPQVYLPSFQPKNLLT